jgi:hypothetical protein
MKRRRTAYAAAALLGLLAGSLLLFAIALTQTSTDTEVTHTVHVKVTTGK